MQCIEVAGNNTIFLGIIVILVGVSKLYLQNFLTIKSQTLKRAVTHESTIIQITLATQEISGYFFFLSEER